MGEAGTVGALPALLNAVNDALAPLGVRHLEFTRSHRVQDCLLIESVSVSYGKATAYLPVIDLQLQSAEFLYETNLFPELEHTFKHALTHEVAYGTLLGIAGAPTSMRPEPRRSDARPTPRPSRT